MSTITVPTSQDLRRDIQALLTELRALKKLLKLAEAAEEAAASRRPRGNVETSTSAKEKEVANA